MRLTLSRVVTSDFDVMIPSQFAAFVHEGGHTAMLGVNNAENIARAKVDLLKDFHEDAAGVWIKITDEDEGGKFVAASCWKIYPTYVKNEVDMRAKEMEGFSAEDVKCFNGQAEKEAAAEILRMFFKVRFRHMREGHVLLHILFTDPAYHGKGAGKIMVEWGNALADHLMLPCWVEASRIGHRLYSSCGYEDVENFYYKFDALPLPEDYTLMKRPLKVRRIEGRGLEKR